MLLFCVFTDATQETEVKTHKIKASARNSYRQFLHFTFTDSFQICYPSIKSGHTDGPQDTHTHTHTKSTTSGNAESIDVF